MKDGIKTYLNSHILLVCFVKFTINGIKKLDFELVTHKWSLVEYKPRNKQFYKFYLIIFFFSSNLDASETSNLKVADCSADYSRAHCAYCSIRRIAN